MNRSGSYLIEFSAGLSILSMVLVLFLRLISTGLVKGEALDLARLGVELQARTNLTDDQIQSVLLRETNRKIFPINVDWSFDLTPPISSPSFRFYNLVKTRVQAVLSDGTRIDESVVTQKESYE